MSLGHFAFLSKFRKVNELSITDLTIPGIKPQPIVLMAIPESLERFFPEIMNNIDLDEVIDYILFLDHPDLSSPKFTDLPAEESSQYISQ